jgi:hypothetical protein
MRLVSATRVLNEDDILEAFVRHHAPMVDHMLFLDNGSHDGSVGLLRALREEGLPITLLQVRSASSEEVSHLTMLHRYAAAALGADWVVHLDADEFLDARAAKIGLRARLAAVPDAQMALELRLVLYAETLDDDITEVIVPVRQQHRIARRHEIYKVLVRGGAVAPRITLAAGNHGAFLDEVFVEAERQEAFLLAHYPRRSAWQQVAKFAIGRLKVLAAGRGTLEANHGNHYAPLYDLLLTRPQELFHSDSFMNGSEGGEATVHDPIDYGGGDLIYTEYDDAALKAVRCLAAYAQELATQHGRLADEMPGVRALLQSWVTQPVRIF